MVQYSCIYLSNVQYVKRHALVRYEYVKLATYTMRVHNVKEGILYKRLVCS